MTTTALAQVDHSAVLKHLGLNPQDPAAQALILVCDRYGLDPVLKHMVLIQGRPYVTRDGLLHVAHLSGRLDGIEVLEVGENDTHHTAKVAIYVRGMSRPFVFPGRYKKGAGNKEYGPEMAIKCSTVMGLRHAFDVSLPAQEERWDVEQADTVVDRVDWEQQLAADTMPKPPTKTPEGGEGSDMGESATVREDSSGHTPSGNIVTDWLFEEKISPATAASFLRKKDANLYGRYTKDTLQGLDDKKAQEVLGVLLEMPVKEPASE